MEEPQDFTGVSSILGCEKPSVLRKPPPVFVIENFADHLSLSPSKHRDAESLEEV